MKGLKMTTSDKKYPEMSPSEIRKKLDTKTELKAKLDTLQDELYCIGKSWQYKQKQVKYYQLQLVKSIYGFLTAEDMLQEAELRKELKDV